MNEQFDIFKELDKIQNAINKFIKHYGITPDSIFMDSKYYFNLTKIKNWVCCPEDINNNMTFIEIYGLKIKVIDYMYKEDKVNFFVCLKDIK